MEVWGNEKRCGNSSRRVFPQAEPLGFYDMMRRYPEKINHELLEVNYAIWRKIKQISEDLNRKACKE